MFDFHSIFYFIFILSFDYYGLDERHDFFAHAAGLSIKNHADTGNGWKDTGVATTVLLLFALFAITQYSNEVGFLYTLLQTGKNNTDSCLSARALMKFLNSYENSRVVYSLQKQ